MTKKELVKRYTLFVISLFISAFGVAFAKHGELGVTPISSVPNVLCYICPALSMGNWLIIWNCVMIIGQILILRKRFQLIQLLQIPLSFLFGYFTDFGLWCVSFIPNQLYPVKMTLVFSGVIVLAFGIALSVIANVIMNSGEAFVKTLADAVHKNFGNVKIIFDISCVVLSIILSLIFFDFKIVGTREGTIITAVCTGFVVKFFQKRLQNPVSNILNR